MTMNTSRIAISSEITTSWIESSMKVEESYATSSFMPGGSRSRSSGSARRTACATSTVLAFCCLTMPRPDRRLTVVARDVSIVLGAHLDVGDVAQVARCVRRGSPRRCSRTLRAERGRRCVRTENSRSVPSTRPDGISAFCVAQRALDVGHGQPVRGQSLRIEPHAHGVLPLAADLHGADALDALQPLGEHVVGDVGQLERAEVLAGEREPDDRLRVHVLLRHDRLVDAGRQVAAHARHAVAHVVRGLVDVAIEIELDGDVGGLLLRGGGERLDALDGGELLLEHVGDLGLDHLRVRAAVEGA